MRVEEKKKRKKESDSRSWSTTRGEISWGKETEHEIWIFLSRAADGREVWATAVVWSANDKKIPTHTIDIRPAYLEGTRIGQTENEVRKKNVVGLISTRHCQPTSSLLCYAMLSELYTVWWMCSSSSSFSLSSPPYSHGEPSDDDPEDTLLFSLRLS
jgi:hypothetical protein